METITLNQSPHFTIINKFFLRVKTFTLYNTQIPTLCFFTETIHVVATAQQDIQATMQADIISRARVANRKKAVTQTVPSASANNQCILLVK